MDNSLDRLEILQDKSLPITVKLLTLCPTKDLVAVVLSDSEVAVYRVLWQKVSSFVIPFGSSNVTVTALEWSPDGNLIAVGRSDGKLDVSGFGIFCQYYLDSCLDISVGK